MDFLSGASRLEPVKALDYRTFANKKYKSRRKTQCSGPAFWLSPKFSSWESSPAPKLIMVKGDYSQRATVQTFVTDIITLLRGQQIPVIWAMKELSTNGPTAASVTDVLKSLVCQAIQVNVSMHTEQRLALSCAQFRAAETPDQWLDLLARVIANLPQLYVVIDIESVGIAYTEAARKTHGFSWLPAFLAMFHRYSSQKWISRLKVLLVSYASGAAQIRDLARYQDLVVSTRQAVSGSSRQRCSPTNFLHNPRAAASNRGRSRYVGSPSL